MEWLLETRQRGNAWIRSPEAERTENEFMRLRESWCRLIEDTGLQYNFVSYNQVEQNELLRGGYRVLIVPRSSALSAAEAKAIHDFVGQGGVVIADGEPGKFDEHDRKLAQSQLADLFAGAHEEQAAGHAFGNGRAIYLNANVLDYQQQRIIGKGGETPELAARLFHSAGVRPEFTVTDEQGRPISGVETHVFRNGDVTILSLLSNPSLRVDELGPPDFRSNEHFAQRRSLKLTLPEAFSVYELRTGKVLGRQRELRFDLDPYQPVIYAVSAEPLPALTVSAPTRIARGETGHLGISFGHTPAAVHVLHVEVTDPAGRAISGYSGNVRAPQGRAVWSIPVAFNDAVGTWHVRVKDVLSGVTRTTAVEVF